MNVREGEVAGAPGDQVYLETKALWERQTMKLHEETARSQLLTESESSHKDALDRRMTAIEAGHASEKEAGGGKEAGKGGGGGGTLCVT